MSRRPPQNVPRFVRRRAPRLVPGLLLALALLATGCGSDGDSGGDEPSKATTACRDRWKDLSDDVNGRDQKTNPSALAQRWNSISATIDLYATSGRASDCGSALTKVGQAMTSLTSFGGRLAVYDMELRSQQVTSDAEEYAAGPAPEAPSASPTPKARKGAKGKKAGGAGKTRVAPQPPTPAEVAAALKTLQQQAPLATRQQEAGWQQARVVELNDSTAVAKAVKDLAFLSTQSSGYRASSAALAKIRTALKAAGS